MSAILYFHRRTGVSFVCTDDTLGRMKERLRETLGDKFVEQEWERLTPHGGWLRVRAVNKGHLDVTLVQDDNVIAG